MRLDTRSFALAAGCVAASMYLLGAVVHLALPWGAPAVVAYIFRVDVIELSKPLTVDSAVVGTITFGACGALFGGMTAWLYNRFTRPAA